MGHRTAPRPRARISRARRDAKIEELEVRLRDKTQNLRRLEAQRNELNGRVRLLREELHMLLEPGSKVGQEGKYAVDIEKDIDITDCKPNVRIALRSDSYVLHKILPSKIDPLVSLMKVEKAPDSTYEMVGGLEKQV